MKARLAALGLLALLPAMTLSGPAWSDDLPVPPIPPSSPPPSGAGGSTSTSTSSIPTTSTGSAGCSVITQAGANGVSARIQADDTIKPPKSVKSMTCLDNFFNGLGLNLVSNLLNPATLLAAVETQVCQMLTSEWNATLGSAQCGITLTGFNLGFGGLGGGLSCPKLSFGGGGPPIGSVGIGVGRSGLYIHGQPAPPTGYTAPNVPPGSF